MKRFLTIFGIFAGLHFILFFVFALFVRFQWASERILNFLGRLLLPIELQAEPKSSGVDILLDIILSASLWSICLTTLIYGLRATFKRRTA